MSKVTSKLQVTVPQALAESYGIRPGDEITWEPAGDVIRVSPATLVTAGRSVEERLSLFDRASDRCDERQKGRHGADGTTRGWSREELYRRGSSD